MVVVSTALVACLGPAADVAVRDRIGIGFFRISRGESANKAAPDLPVIGSVIGEAKALRLEIRPWRNDVHPLRCRTLNRVQEVGVQAELKNTPGFGLARELRIDRSYDHRQGRSASRPGAKCRRGPRNRHRRARPERSRPCRPSSPIVFRLRPYRLSRPHRSSRPSGRTR